MRLLALLLSLSIPAWADAPGESYQVVASAVSESVLREAKAILTLAPTRSTTSVVGTYRRAYSGFAPLGAMDIGGLTPISGSGVHKRFLVSELDGPKARLVTNPYSGGGVWVDLDELRNSSWSVSAVPLDAVSSATLRLDPFFLWGGQSRPVCPAPGMMEACASLRRGATSLLRVVEQRGDYIKVVGDSDREAPAVPLGWLPIHDAAGKLSVWFIHVDDC
ncbi:MAG: hypothetical protein HYZ75_08530 [Elusimicrobia bacterium]|nr:hypothetical protein [Elusimicrobiota bacterium]